MHTAHSFAYGVLGRRFDELGYAEAPQVLTAAEQYAWMRFGDDARKRGDGVPVDALELGPVTSWMARRYFDPESWFWRFGRLRMLRSRVSLSGGSASPRSSSASACTTPTRDS